MTASRLIKVKKEVTNQQAKQKKGPRFKSIKCWSDALPFFFFFFSPRLLLLQKGRSDRQPVSRGGFWEEGFIRQLHHQGAGQSFGLVRPQEEWHTLHRET